MNGGHMNVAIIIDEKTGAIEIKSQSTSMVLILQ